MAGIDPSQLPYLLQMLGDNGTQRASDQFSLTTPGGPPQPNFAGDPGLLGPLPNRVSPSKQGPAGPGSRYLQDTPSPSPPVPSNGGNTSIGNMPVVPNPNNPSGPGYLGVPPGFNRSFKFPPGTFGN